MMKINLSKIIQVNNLSVSYSSHQLPVLRNLQLDVDKGDHLAIIGSSGCGKSTFAKSIVQMLPEGSICKGSLSINGKDLRYMNKQELPIFRRKNFGYIYQDSIKKLNPLMTVGSHLYELLKIHLRYQSNIKIENKVKELFYKVGINPERLNSFPHEFSGGMRQRVSIAMALALKPSILIADEPTTSLDTLTSYQIMNQLLYLCKSFGSTLILISHDINLAAKWCKNVAIIDEGRIVEKGKIDKVFNSPKTKIGNKLVKSNYVSLRSDSCCSLKSEVILEVVNLRYWYRLNSSIFMPKWNKAINEVSFQLSSNETLGIVGISGSGKSTLGKVLIGLLKKRGGLIKIKDYELKSTSNKKIEKAKVIQMIFQDPFSSLNPKMTIKRLLKDVFLIHNTSNKENFENVLKDILEILNLPYEKKFLDSYPNELSGGQLQRISIARVLFIKPKILICDESFNMLDNTVKIEILYLLRKIQKEMRLSIIFVTHDLGLAKKFCNRILILNNGFIVEEGDSLSIFKNPKHDITKQLINSCLNIT